MANDRMPFCSTPKVIEKKDNQLRKHNTVWEDINTLLRFLDGGPKTVPDCVDDYFLRQFGNSAPGELLRDQIKRVQKHLENAD